MSEALPLRSQLLPHLVRLRAPNPSPMTGEGTNTYVLTGAACVVIDPGPMVDAHLHAILAELGNTPLAAILVTHAHLDHSALAPALAAAKSAPIAAFGPATSGRSAAMIGLAAAGMTGGGEGVDTAFTPNLLLHDGQKLRYGPHSIEVIHTPGHMGGHLCFAIDEGIFSGDHVMGWASSLVSPPDGDMAEYRASLAKLATRNTPQMWPGHGAEITAPALRLRDLQDHRQARETAVLAALRKGPATAAGLVAQIYTDTPQSLHPAAARNILAHLIDLFGRNRVTTFGTLSFESEFHLS